MAMVLDAVANFIRGATDAAVDNSQTTIPVENAGIFPDPSTEGEFNVVIWDADSSPRPDQDPNVEILRVTAIDTGADELTVTRAQETTAAAAHPSGSAVHLSPTAKMFSDIESEYTAQGEDFDGEGTSEFTNLQSVSTGDLSYSGSLPFTLSRSDYPDFASLIQDIPNISLGHQNEIGLRIALSDNATYTISEILRESHIGELQILGNRAAPADRPTITPETGDPAVSIESCKTRIGGVDFDGGGNSGESAVFAGAGAEVELRDMNVTGSYDTWSVDALRATRLSLNDSVTITGPGKGSGEGVRVHSTNNASISGTIQDFDIGLFVDRGGTVDGLGDLTFNNVKFATYAEDGADVKIVQGAGSVSYSNVDIAAVATNNAFIELGEGIDYTGVGQMYRLNGGSVRAPDAKDPANQTTSHIYHGSGWITQPGPFSGSWIVSFAPPGFPVRGQMAIADGNDWNPLGNGNAGIVGYDGSVWQTIHDYGSPFGGV